MKVGVFWDYENCQMPSGAQSCDVVERIRTEIYEHGPIHLFHAYVDARHTNLSNDQKRSQIRQSGVKVVDCPHDDKKNVADFQIMADILAFALDNPAPSVIVLISGDLDFSSFLGELRNRQYIIVLIQPMEAKNPVMKTLAHRWLHWKLDVLSAPEARDEENSRSDDKQDMEPNIRNEPSSPALIGRISKNKPKATEDIEHSQALLFLEELEPDFFDPLIDTLKRLQGLDNSESVLRSRVGMTLNEKYPHVFKRKKFCPSFKQYARLAEVKGLIVLGGESGTAWIKSP
ncbi:DUF537-domain-containing protein [Rhizoclosmatium globosum]|uniref:DUF537-domain-containing protein n=1 Tax=Rhizoclosmatium globosum TaxID=329046 RepID=A0A1Y1ZX01_9FUNG|nr:DUF537-domain-containing protein [Rhizoclosmatium globosum]|eukprot:ORY14738.1 DUF537-domain-containing protein [Rhizoclosmatium globosum]